MGNARSSSENLLVSSESRQQSFIRDSRLKIIIIILINQMGSMKKKYIKMRGEETWSKDSEAEHTFENYLMQDSGN